MVPILLLTGFLGSGKTTLLNRLLDARPNSGPFSESAGKLALIVNEFGDVGIDGDLLPDEMTRQIEIKGGCICCRLDEDLAKTLKELVATQPDLSAIIIETTGIAEPLPISWTLAGDALAQSFRLAAVITVVDALEHETHRPLSASVDAQVEYADLLVVTKLDVAGQNVLARLQTSLRTLNSVAPIISGKIGEVVDELWATIDDPSFDVADKKTRAPEQAETRNSSHSFESAVVPINSVLDFETLTEMLEELPSSYIRIKGIAIVVDASTGSTVPRLVAFHRVGARISCETLDREDSANPPASRLVAIGSRIDANALASCVRLSVLP